jgi:ParB family transcriptional regulator, chromosome partitioning protein
MSVNRSKFTIIRIDDIVVRDRIRIELSGFRSSAEDIGKNGLLHPIVVNEDNVLITGYRRLEAHKLLDKDEIEVHVVPINDIMQVR